VARALGDVPKVSEAFRLGEISYSKVRAMTRVANADNEDSLLMIAKHGTARHVETLVSGYRQAKRLNEEGIAGQQQRSREFNYHWDDDGSLVFSGRKPKLPRKRHRRAQGKVRGPAHSLKNRFHGVGRRTDGP
jgi:hypothetical protein